MEKAKKDALQNKQRKKQDLEQFTSKLAAEKDHLEKELK